MTFESLRKEEHEEWAALYATGALNPDEIRSFRDHLTSGCEICTLLLRDFEAVTTEMRMAVSVEPPPELRSALLMRLSQERPLGKNDLPQGIVLQKTGILVSRPEEIPWLEVPIPGVRIKHLYMDSERKYSTTLVSLEAGAVYPAHQHNDTEQFYLLEGDLSGEGIQLKPGDYCRSEAGTIHGAAKTKSGALLLVWSSRRDKFL